MKNRNMKSWCIISLFFVFSFVLKLHAQPNLIPNPSFENGPNYPNCFYPYDSENEFDKDISDWRVARRSNPRNGTPYWADKNLGHDCKWNFMIGLCPLPQQNSSSTLFFSSNRFIALSYEPYKASIRVSLAKELIASRTYIMRMKVIPIPIFLIGVGDSQNYYTYVKGANSHLRVFFTEWAEAWSSNSNDNQKFEAYNANIVMPHFSGTQNCQWHFIEREFTVPSNLGELRNLVLYIEDNGFIIDDVELFEKCAGRAAGDYYIQNKVYHNFNTIIPESGSITEKSSNFLEATNTTIQSGASVTYTAPNKITLKSGFKAENGSNFRAVISSCPNNYRSSQEEVADYNSYDWTEPHDVVMARISQNQEAAIKNAEESISFTLYPNPTSGLFTITIPSNSRPLNLAIYDAMGKTIYEAREIADQALNVNLSAYAKGIYLVKVSDGNEIKVSRVIHQ